jgi:5-methylcytosine-specific restriction endonuclease McrA
MSSVLVLNATYEPLSIISVRRAIILLLKDKAELLEAAEQRIRAADFSLPVPLVIRLIYMVRVPHRLNVPLSRHTVMMRDNYTCQYCGTQPTKANLTIDHILPKVRGGGTSWDNVVCACKTCNLHKGAKTPEEASMRLRSKPDRPRFLAVAFLSRVSTSHEAWDKYLPPTPLRNRT